MMGSLISSLREAIVLLVADVAGIFGLFNLAHFLRTGQWMPPHSLSLAWIATVFLLTMYVFDVYRGVLREGSTKLVMRTAFAVVVAAGVMASLVYVIKPGQGNALYWRGVLPVGTAMFLVWAITWRKILATSMQSRMRGCRWLVLGYGPLASCLWRDVSGKSGLGQLCFLEEGSGDAGSRAVNTPGPEGSVSALPEFLERSWTGVILATEQAPGDATLSELMRARLRGVRIYDLTDFYERFLFKLPVLNLRDGWLILAHGFDLLHHTIALRAKRVIDLVLSFALMVALSPLMLVTAPRGAGGSRPLVEAVLDIPAPCVVMRVPGFVPLRALGLRHARSTAGPCPCRASAGGSRWPCWGSGRAAALCRNMVTLVTLVSVLAGNGASWFETGEDRTTAFVARPLELLGVT
jgi:hypothetical protein